MLSSSYDWSTKMWTPKQSTKSLVSFESDDYLYDVQWNPQNPALFATADNDGLVKLWDVTYDLEQPIFTVNQQKQAVNKIRWNTDGSKLIVGDTAGAIQMYSLDKSVTIFQLCSSLER